ncbi:DNA-3-methyladenine glycosylase-like [Portunus trituberculatus]|uniref:DNA-3-methyladenine glycosylase n=1 Tax=Portunus trituberculatus TaxID=210409 RepID=A0A5B7FAC0_PORTR|nr:DNA-3-methyladenine glycosylase-like [Portunus trituberculatus]MPC42199.1 DNA-3-methyladenine glycosylase [Portunus trituberculatus]
MPRKRTLTSTNTDCKVPKASHTTEDEIRSPYFGDPERVSEASEREEGKAKESLSVLLDPIVSLPAPAQPRGSGQKLTEEFYDQECVALAKALLGKVMVRVVEGRRVSARVVETESYLGGPDQASHSCGGKRTPRNEPMYMKPGTAYVYSIYGMYHCFNVSSRGDGACVLVRAAEPLEGLEVMVQGRGARRGTTAPPLKPHQLCNGPSKLCQALALTKESANKLDLAESDVFWMEEEEEEEQEDGIGEAGVCESLVVVSTRIGIDSYGVEWAKKPLRFYILGNKCVSVKDKQAEKYMVG